VLSHAYGAAFDNPDLLVAAVVGDGEAETGALATSWHSNKFINTAKDGVVLPILHLNGYKIANPTVLARIPADDLRSLMVGYGHNPYFSKSRRTTTPRTHTGDSRRCSTPCSTRSQRSRRGPPTVTNS
jgi:phosphoketolase